MEAKDLERIITKVVETRLPPPKMEFSKKLILGAFLFYGVMCLLGYAAWFIRGEWPQELIDLAWPFGAVIIGYLGKSAYENKAKIQRKGKEDSLC